MPALLGNRMLKQNYSYTTNKTLNNVLWIKSSQTNYYYGYRMLESFLHEDIDDSSVYLLVRDQRASENVYWVMLDTSNGNPETCYGRNYLWIFDTKEAALKHRKQQHKTGGATLAMPVKCIIQDSFALNNYKRSKNRTYAQNYVKLLKKAELIEYILPEDESFQARYTDRLWSDGAPDVKDYSRNAQITLNLKKGTELFGVKYVKNKQVVFEFLYRNSWYSVSNFTF